MSFATFKFQLGVLLDRLASPLIRAWKDHGKWTLPAVKEAVPFSLLLVQRFEHACVSSAVDPDDQLLLACFLLMCWGGLPFSDAQRLDLRSVVCCEEAIRGRCWRTKSSPRGMCWGLLRRGCLVCDWGGILFKLTLLPGQSIQEGIIFSRSRDARDVHPVPGTFASVSCCVRRAKPLFGCCVYLA